MFFPALEKCGRRFALLLLLTPRAICAEAPADNLTAGWELMAQSLTNDAAAKLATGALPSSRELTWARAVVRLDQQPVTEEHLREVEAACAALATGDDDIADAAAYLRARIYQVHTQRPDYPRAATLYRELAERHPHSHWAQLGLVKLGLLVLYALPEPAAPEARIAAAMALLPRLEERELQRDLQLQIGHAGTHYQQSLDSVLPHLLAADRLGGLVGQTEEDLTCQIGELSLRAGHHAQAKEYFERYLRDYPQSGRCITVTRRLHDLAQLETKEGQR